MTPPLIAKREELTAKQKALADIIAEAGPDLDFEKITSLEGDTKGKVEAVQAMDKELNDLADEVKELADLERIADGVKDLGDQLKKPAGDRRASAPTILHDGSREPEPTIGELVTESNAFKAYRDECIGQQGHMKSATLERGGIKTLFQTSAGWAPESIRIGRVIEDVTRPIQVLDIIPPGNTGQAAIVYMEETTRTHSAAERAENAAHAESAFVLTERSSTVRSIGASIPVTDEQLEDVAQVRSYLDLRLSFGVRQRLDNQVLQGNGTAPNLEGVLNATGIQTQAKGADPVFDAIHKAMTLVTVTGRATPSAHCLHPNDWEALRLTRTADGIYILGNPSDAGLTRLWGLPVVVTDVLAENTGLTGDFATFCQLFERRGIVVQIGYVNDDFLDGRQTIRVSMRVAFVVYRAAAFCTITSI